jgi:hypothetical protein
MIARERRKIREMPASWGFAGIFWNSVTLLLRKTITIEAIGEVPSPAPLQERGPPPCALSRCVGGINSAARTRTTAKLRSSRHLRGKQHSFRALNDQDHDFRAIENVGGARRWPHRLFGTRASANTSGPDSTWQRAPVKLRTSISAPNEENLFSSAGPISDKRVFEKSIQPFDLMSRRHPLSSTRAFRFEICL